LKPNPLEVQKKIYGDMKRFAHESKLKKLKDKYGPKEPPHPAMHITIATGTHTPVGHPMDDMAEEDLEKMVGGKKTKLQEKAEEDAEE